MRTPRQEIKKPVRSSSVERKDFQNLSRTSSEKSLSIDYRKLVREKVDKKTKESFKSFEKTILNKWTGLLMENLKEKIEEKKFLIFSSVKTCVESMTKEFYPRIKESSNRMVESLKKNKDLGNSNSSRNLSRAESREKKESFQKSYQKNENIREMVKDIISKTQYKNTNDIEKIIESFVQRETRESISFIKQRLMSDIENSIFSAFAKIRPRFLNNVEDVSSENTFLTPVGSLKSSSKQINQPVIQKHLEKPLNNKILPKNSSGVSLKEFLKYEKIAKSSFS